jgi:sugar phosphate isomerase/epimerase
MKTPQIGIQLYSVREVLSEDFPKAMETISKLGFMGVEFAYNYGGMTPKELAEFLKKHNLQAIGLFEKIDNLCNPEAEIYSMATALDCKHLTFGFNIIQLEDDFDKCLSLCREAVKVATAKNLTLCYHAHAHEIVNTGKTSYLNLLLSAQGLEELAFEADTCWIDQGGENVLEYLRKYEARIPLLHVKDVTAEGEITELGDGLIDIAAAAEFAAGSEIPWLIYEQDNSDLPSLESAAKSIKYLKNCI